MKGIFVNKDDRVTVSIHVSLTEKGSVIASHVKSAVEEVKGKGNEIYSFDAVFRRPSYRDDMNVLSDSLRTDGNTVELNPAAIRYLRLNQLILSWTLVDENNNEVKPIPENIDRLSPSVGNALVIGLDVALNQ